MLLTTGRTLYQFNASTLSQRTANALLRPSDTLDMSAADAAHYGVVEGETVRVSSRYGTAILPVHISPSMQAGQLFSTFHRPDLFVNRLTSPVRDRLVRTPEYKVAAVRVEKLTD
ncbi:molybdopterin dinucleotide binding domain-containing protein [Burkholderia cenocepacia]|uniref:molybdopterin dinucleotide binding domain-containing protein n=1 Tax=Burkholderia cenocepacia TaxID=95486 RepID=UPI001F2DE46D|nr:molybdopterin dinucleotide binding domain-containing protein [Burkholderia cenocepacia]